MRYRDVRPHAGNGAVLHFGYLGARRRGTGFRVPSGLRRRNCVVGREAQSRQLVQDLLGLGVYGHIVTSSLFHGFRQIVKSVVLVFNSALEHFDYSEPRRLLAQRVSDGAGSDHLNAFVIEVMAPVPVPGKDRRHPVSLEQVQEDTPFIRGQYRPAGFFLGILGVQRVVNKDNYMIASICLSVPEEERRKVSCLSHSWGTSVSSKATLLFRTMKLVPRYSKE